MSLIVLGLILIEKPTVPKPVSNKQLISFAPVTQRIVTIRAGFIWREEMVKLSFSGLNIRYVAFIKLNKLLKW